MQSGSSTGFQFRPGLPLRALKLVIFLGAFWMAFLIGVSSASADEGEGPSSEPASPVATEGDSRDEDEAEDEAEADADSHAEDDSEPTTEQTPEEELEPAPEAPAESDTDSASDAPGTSEPAAHGQARSRESSTGQGHSGRTTPPEEAPEEAAKSVRRAAAALRTTRARALRTLERQLAKSDHRAAAQEATTLVGDSVGSVAGIVDPVTQGLIGIGLGDVIGRPAPLGVVPPRTDGPDAGPTSAANPAARTQPPVLEHLPAVAAAPTAVAVGAGAHLPGDAATDLAENDTPAPSGLGLPLEAIVASGGTASGTAAVAVTTLALLAGGLPSDARHALTGPPPSVGGRPGFAPD